MIRQILLVRHGETNGNKQGIVQMPETPLNHHGRLQAQRVARRVAEQCVREQLVDVRVQCLDGRVRRP